MLQEPSEKTKNEIYEFYIKIFDSSFDVQKKRNLLTSIAGWEPWSWRVVGITAKAVGEIVKVMGHYKVKSNLIRDHFFQTRADTSRNMLKKKLDFESYWKEFWENDRTVLMTKLEHNYIESTKKDDRTILKKFKNSIFEIDWRLGHFQSNKVAGFRYSKKREGIFILMNYQNNIILDEDGNGFTHEEYWSRRR